MYGSSLRIETWRPRALRSRPTLAAVMPLPREEVTPPVTKTYFAMGRVLRGFFECYRKVPPESNRSDSETVFAMILGLRPLERVPVGVPGRGHQHVAIGAVGIGDVDGGRG